MTQSLPVPSSISRRSTLVRIAGTAVITSLPALAFATDNDRLFHHGVASGDPDHVSVVLWTRVSTDRPVSVEWQMAQDSRFSRIVASGASEANAETDHTVKVLATGLKPGERYYYRFRVGKIYSPVGRTRTLPNGHIDRLCIALASCSNYAFGHFNAYAAIARDPKIDFVLHTGDYIYEYGGDGSWGDAVATQLGRRHAPAHEIVSLNDYRQRHAQYKSDPGAQAMHAAHPFIACWDDHESANNPWTGGAQNHQPEKEGSWQERRAASIRAYFEWMPVREPSNGRSRMQFWRTYSFGDLAMLTTLETRHTARALQVDYRDHAGVIQSKADADRLIGGAIAAPGRAMISAEQEADLTAALGRSVQQGQPWRLIGNPMPIARVKVPDVVGMGLLPDPATQKAMPDEARQLAWKGKWNLPFYPDTWDGYDWARERLYTLARDVGAADLVFLTGDSHSFWANELADGQGRAIGIELGTAGISSPGDFVESGFGPELSRKFDEVFAAHNPEVVWTDNMHQGFVRLDLTHTGARAHFIAVKTVLKPDSRVHTLKRYAIRSREGKVSLTEMA